MFDFLKRRAIEKVKPRIVTALRTRMFELLKQPKLPSDEDARRALDNAADEMLAYFGIEREGIVDDVLDELVSAVIVELAERLWDANMARIERALKSTLTELDK